MGAVLRAGRLLLPSMVALSVACGVRENVIARVGAGSIEIGAFQAYLEAASGGNWQTVDERVVTRLLDQFLDQEVIAVAALESRQVEVPTLPDERSMAVRSLISEVCGAVPPVPEEAVEREVARRLGDVHPARAHVRQLLLDSAAEADAAGARLEEGESFLAVSRDVSRAPNAGGGGELGFVAQGTLPPDLEEVIFSMSVGEISKPVQSPAGYHIFEVLRVVPEGPVEPSEVRMIVRRELAEATARDVTRECVDRLASEVGVMVFRDHLWFTYQGRYWEGNDGG